MRRIVHAVHFVGIGGVGMSVLAEYLHAQGYRVSGSDLHGSDVLESLNRSGIETWVGHDASHIGDAELVVYSSAIPAENPERAAAVAQGRMVIARGELLAEILRQKDAIAIAGTHGKTTTTALVAHLLKMTGRDPTAFVGGRPAGRGKPAHGLVLGESDWCVAEADESDGSFLMLSPEIAVITNIDADHLDHYGDFAALEDAFAAFIASIPFWGVAIVCSDHPGVRQLLPRVNRRVVRYGFGPDADVRAVEVTPDDLGMRFQVLQQGNPKGSLRIPVPGRHNVANTLAALCVGLELGIPFADAAPALEHFPGVARRFEIKGSAHGVQVVDDYGHHPVEVRATLAAARDAHHGRVVTIFQPHRFTRTRDCFEDFTTSFADTDVLIVTDTYAAGEAPIAGAEAERLADAIRKAGHADVRFIAAFDEIVEDLPASLEEGDLLLTLGAGNVCEIGPRLLDALRAHATSEGGA